MVLKDSDNRMHLNVLDLDSLYHLAPKGNHAMIAALVVRCFAPAPAAISGNRSKFELLRSSRVR